MEINIKANKFDNDDIIKTQSYKIIQDNSVQRNTNPNKSNINYNISNYNNYNTNNFDNDEDKNINLNININNYLSKKNININSNAPINNFNYPLKNNQKLTRYNTDLTQGYLIRHNNKKNNQQYINDNIKQAKEELKSKLLSRIDKHRIFINNFDSKKINITTKKGLTESNYINNNNKNNIKEKPKEKEQVKHVPKILTFLQTFKNMALPLKIDKNKKKEDKNNIIENKNSNYNYNYKPIMKKSETNKRNEENNENITNDEECIDYNRFTFRNSESPNQRKKRERKNRIKNKEIEKPLYNEDSSDNDINKNINIDAYNRRYENKNKIIHNRDRYKNRYINNYNQQEKINHSTEEFSPNFKQNINTKKDSYQKKINHPYSRKNNFKEQYSSPRPLPKNQIKNRHIYINDNVSEKNERTYQNEYNIDSGNESEYSFNSFRSLNPGKIYRKQILNNSFQINENNNNSLKNNSNYYINNNMSSDQINLEQNYYTINRQNRKKKINEILININDSEDYSYNTEKNYDRPNNYMRNNRSPINRKENTTNNNILLNRSPLSSKQINNIPYDYSDYYESQAEQEYNKNNNNKKQITNYSRFMQPFEQKEKKIWNKEDSYLSYDIENINKKHLYKKPVQNISSQMNKNENNSMYIKRIVHYDNNKNTSYEESNDSLTNRQYSNYEEINNNVFDFDAPKSINDFIDDKFSSNYSINMNESSRDNKFSINSDFPTDRSKKDEINLNTKQNMSFKEEEKPKIYTKKLNTMYNFYQGTKNFFSKINNKVFNLIKKTDKNNNNNINNTENIKKDNLINNEYVLTPRDNMDNNNKKDNLFPSNNYFFTPTGFENKPKIIKNQKNIKEIIKTKKNFFCKKFYNYCLKAIRPEDFGFYFSKRKIDKIKPRKKIINVPNSLSKYSIKRKIIISTNKIPLIDKCYFGKIFLIKANKEIKKETETIKNNNYLRCDNQINIILSKKNNLIENNKNNNNKNIFEKQNIKPDNIWNVSFINTKNKSNSINKKYQYEYNYILSLKNAKSSLKDDLLPENIKTHFNNMNKYKDIIYDKNQKQEKNELRKKFNKGEMQQIINRYSKPNKISQTNKNEINKDINIDKWKRIDFTKETEEAEKYIKELNKKMEENCEQNNIIGMLNILTMDNLDDVLKKLMTLITRNEDNFILSDEEIIKNEYILIKAILNKAILETRFVNLYAKLSNELFHKLNNVSYNSDNFKTIIIDECKNKFNELSKNENISKNKVVSLDDEKIILIKKSFIGNIDFISELINFNLFTENIGFYYLEELNKIYNNNNYSEQTDKLKMNIALEATINFLSKFGKKIFSNNNIYNINKLNNFINSNLKSILDNKDLSGFLKYKIINLIEKQKNKWQDSLYEKSILAKGKFTKDKNSSKKKKTRKRRHSNKSLKIINQSNTIKNKSSKNNCSGNASLNSSTLNYLPHINLKLNTSTSNSYSYMDDEMVRIIEEDIIKYKTFLNENNINNKNDLNKNRQIGNGFNWSSIEEILSTNKINLIEIIRCFIEVCIDDIIESSKIYYANDYIKNIIYYYSTQLTNKERDIIRNKISNLFINIRDICIDNHNMKEIMGYLMLILIENKLFFIKELNNFIGKEKEIIITIAEVVKYAIISSEEKCKKYHNDFKQTKLFVDNSIFNENVTNMISEYLK